MHFDTLSDGRSVDRLTIQRGDLSASFLTLGATLQEVRLAGVPYNLTLGYDRAEDYLGPRKYYGAIVGPVGNRLKGARARVGGIEHMLTPNEGRNTLHSAEASSHAKIWTVEDHQPDSVTMSVTLPDGEAGFPGNQRLMVHFVIRPDNVLRMEITATTDEDAMLNVVNHSYWNLTGAPTFEGHQLQVNAQAYLPTDEEKLPTGIEEVEGTAYDFRRLRDLVPAQPPLDHNFCLSRIRLDLRDVLILKGGDLTMTVATDMPGIQVYDARHGGYHGLAIEPQFWPNAPHEPNFPRIQVKKGEIWTQETEWRFSR